MKTYPLTEPLAHKPRHPEAEVELVVFHGTAGGNVSGAVTTLRANNYSYHYIIAKDGKVYKCIPSASYGYHAGSSYGPKEQAAGVSTEQYPWTKRNASAGRVGKFVANCSVNGYSIGICFVNKEDGQDPITEAQLKAAHALMADLLKVFPIEHVTTHAIISPGRKFDPKGFDLDEFALVCGVKAWRR